MTDSIDMVVPRSSVLACTLAMFAVSEPRADADEAQTCAAPQHPQPLLVRVREGWIRGQRGAGVDRFLAIPYAAAPVGSARFRPPGPPTAWEGVRPAGAAPPSCVQTGGGGDEDCLYLSVIRPTRPEHSRPLPVLFWIHGGSFKVGSGLDNDPARIASETDTVVVMINYRLGPLGFLAHPALGAEAEDGMSGQYGLLDQQQALRWVHDNIGALGGDTERVTIAGGSAGGVSVCDHLASPAVAGLFAGAAILSGACVAAPMATAEERGITFAALVGCEGPDAAECLRSKSAEELASSDSFALSSLPPWGGALLPEEPQEAVSNGRAQRVPVLLGGTEHESRAGLVQQFPVAEEVYVSLVGEWFGDAGAVLEQYPADAYDDPFHALTDVISDSGRDGLGPCVNRRIARALASFAPVYVYEFADDTAPIPAWAAPGAADGLWLGATHGSDEVYWFDRPHENLRLDPTQRQVADAMVEALGRFVRRGSPSGRGSHTRWPRYDAAHERVKQFAAAGATISHDWAERHRCDFWSSVRL